MLEKNRIERRPQILHHHTPRQSPGRGCQKSIRPEKQQFSQLKRVTCDAPRVSYPFDQRGSTRKSLRIGSLPAMIRSKGWTFQRRSYQNWLKPVSNLALTGWFVLSWRDSSLPRLQHRIFNPTKSVFKVDLQKSSPTQMRHLILFISNSKGYVDGFVGVSTSAERRSKHLE